MNRALVVAAVALLGVAAVATASSNGADATPNEKVTICHATSSETNPYTVNTVDTSSIDEQNNRYLNGHGDHERDIIPPFPGFEGRNWDAVGQAIHANGCRIPAPELEVVAPLAVAMTGPTCDAPGDVIVPTVEGVEYTTTVHDDGSVTVTAAAADGCVLADGCPTEWSFTAAELAQLPADHPDCVAVLPPTEPEEPTVVEPVPEATSTDAVEAAPATLPSTGAETWRIFLIGLTTLLAGTGLYRLGKRPA